MNGTEEEITGVSDAERIPGMDDATPVVDDEVDDEATPGVDDNAPDNTSESDEADIK